MLRLCTCALLSTLTIGCVTTAEDPADDVGTIDQGLTEIRIDARSLLAANITRVTLEAGGQAADLTLNLATGTYDGSLILPIGTQSLVAKAFAGADLVGASNPIAVTIATGQVTRVELRILDLTGSAPPLYGPLLDSLVHPTTAQAAAPVALAAQVIAPAGDPVTYAWSSSCADSAFSAPAAAATSWTKATPGSCTITMSATSNGFSLAQSFPIVVFPAGSSSGAVEVGAAFISTPTLFLSLPGTGCFVSPGSNASCAAPTASPSTTAYELSVTSWGGSTAGTLALSDSCGGHFGTVNSGPDFRSGAWLPPVGAGLCILTATATSADGLVGTLSAAILVRAGTPAAAQPPQIFAQVFPNFCGFDSNAPAPIDCGPIPAGTVTSLFGNVSWADGTPESLTLIDSCSGGGLIQPSNAFNFSSPWTLPATPGQTCTLTVRAKNLQGGTSEASAQYHLL